MDLSLDLVDFADFDREHGWLAKEGISEWPEKPGGLATQPLRHLLRILPGYLAAVIVGDGAPVGFDVVEVKDWWVEGHIGYIVPKARYQGVWRWYMDEICERIRRDSLLGFHFHSALPIWKTAGPSLGFRVEPSEYPGLTHYVREV